MKKRIALILAAAMVVSAVLSGCSKSQPSGDNKTTEPAKPQDKQELTINLGSEPPQLDSAKATDSVSFAVLNNTMEGLTRQAEGYKYSPGIAEKWETSADGLTWTFHLRDAKWSDGKPVTAQDFKYAWTRLADPRTAAEYSYFSYYIKGAQELNSIDVKAADFQAKFDAALKNFAVEAPDAKTLKVTLSAPTPFFLGLTSFPVFLPQRQDIVEKFNTKVGDKVEEKYGAEPTNLIYDGPYALSEWKHDDHLVLAKNANYWDAGKVKLDKITMLMVKDQNTSVQMFETGDVDRIGVSGANVAKYKNDPGYRQMLDLSSWYLEFNMTDKVTGNANFRKAVSASIDRKAWVDAILNNGSLPAPGLVPTVISSGVEGKEYRAMAGNMVSPTADKAAAQKFWDAAKKEIGKDQVTLKFTLDEGDVPKRMGEAFQAMIQDALPGVKVELEQVAFKVRLDMMRNHNFQVVFAGWGPDYNDPTTYLDLFKSDSTFNDPGWKNAKYDELLKKAEANANVAERAQQMVDAEKILNDEMPIVPIYDRMASSVIKPYVKGYTTFAIGASPELKFTYIEGKGK